MNAAAAVRELVERSGMSKKSLCVTAGVSRSSLDSYLKGERQPSVAQLERLGRAAGLHLDIAWVPYEVDARQDPDWLIPDNPDMRPQALSVADRAKVLELVVATSMLQQRRERGPLEIPPFKTYGRSG